jgi:hypothetical protein
LRVGGVIEARRREKIRGSVKFKSRSVAIAEIGY